jgi:hypothetical protein
MENLMVEIASYEKRVKKLGGKPEVMSGLLGKHKRKLKSLGGTIQKLKY